MLNKKLQKLITQHGGYWNHGDFNMGSSVEFSDKEIEQLLLAVIKECIVAVETHGGMCGQASSAKIKEHFGVK